MAQLVTANPASHTARLIPPSDTAGDALMDALADRFYVNERGTLISNRYNTEFLCFPSDLDPRHKDYLKEKIKGVMEYTTTFKDVEELNALHYIPKKEPTYYLTLGLYLYLADECSRLGKKESFLSAMREAKATLGAGEEFKAEDLLAKTKATLGLLGMKESHERILQEWRDTCGYTIQGERNELDSSGHLKGAYALLARDISMQKHFLGMNLPISYALGNEGKMLKMHPQRAYAFTKSLTGPHYQAPAHVHITSCIKQGNDDRIKKIYEVIGTEMHGVWEENQHRLLAREEDNRAFAKQVLSLVPKALRNILYYEGYTCAYTNGITIEGCYPDKPMKGETHEEYKKYSISNGLRDKRYRTIFLSNTDMERVAGPEGDRQLTQRVAQILSHEIMHIAISHLNKRDKESLLKSVDDLHDEITRRDGNLPDYLKGNFQETLDSHDDYYKRCSTEAGPISFQMAQLFKFLNSKKVTNHQRKEIFTAFDKKLHTEFAKKEPENEEVLAKAINEDGHCKYVKEKIRLDKFLEEIAKGELSLDNPLRSYENKMITNLEKEEVVCNLLGLMVRHPNMFATVPDRNYPPDSPYHDLPSLEVLAHRIDDMTKIAASNCALKFNHIGVPGVTSSSLARVV